MTYKGAFVRAVEAEMELIEADITRSLLAYLDEVFFAPAVLGPFLARTCTFCDKPPAHKTSRCEEHTGHPCSHCGDECCSYDEDC